MKAESEKSDSAFSFLDKGVVLVYDRSMKKYLDKEEVMVIRELGVTDKYGKWVQVEVLSGENIGMRKPASLNEIKEKWRKVLTFSKTHV